jgi:hypothetical protein
LRVSRASRAFEPDSVTSTLPPLTNAARADVVSNVKVLSAAVTCVRVPTSTGAGAFACGEELDESHAAATNATTTDNTTPSRFTGRTLNGRAHDAAS